MSRRLACLSIPDFTMQIFLFERPEWKGDAVVLLDRNEANGRIMSLNPAASALGLGRGMLYGPCLGIHRNLKAGVIDSGRRRDWQERIENLLLGYSPVVERSDFLEGVWWLDASGLSALYPSVRPWLEALQGAIFSLGLDCGATAGSGRYSTYASSLMLNTESSPPVDTAGFRVAEGRSGPAESRTADNPALPPRVRIFADAEAENSWFSRVPVGLFPLKAETRMLLERLKISSLGSLLKIPLPDIRRRLDDDIAALATRIRQDRRLPLQGISPPPAAEWSFPLEDPISSAGPLCYVADRLIARCREHARRLGMQVRSMRFVLEGGDRERELVVRPARPTRDENRLSRLFASRLEYLDLEVPVRGVRCIGSFSPPVTPQGTLFGSDGDNRLQNARKVLAALQAERGGSAVQYARLKEDPLPVRCFELVDWTDFPEADSRVSIGPKAVGSGGEETAVGEASRSVQSLSPGSAAPEFSAAARRSSAPEGRPVSPASEDPAAETRRRKFPDLPLTRRVVLNPHPLEGRFRTIARVDYSGGWWDRPYDCRMAWAETRGRICWLSGDQEDSSWELVGWLD